MIIDRIKVHFEEEAKEFDSIIQKLIPHYNDMIEALVSVIPFAKDSSFSIIDLGCGTGTIAKEIKSNFKNADITCVDISPNMLEIAKTKAGSGKYIQADFNSFAFPEKYDLIVSSLALHHLENDNAKLEFYKKIYEALTPDGVFINIDVVLGEDDIIQNAYMEKWKSFMRKNVSKQEITDKWLPNYYAEDRPAQLMTHIDMLKKSGFSIVDIIYKYYNFSVYLAKI
ncbi:MAG: class I SAM-dependent methyltransferase [Endomicrobia bacterium]|nr:class I SAM-dependent methyltransferase [Endomicrobiia bacterium]